MAHWAKNRPLLDAAAPIPYLTSFFAFFFAIYGDTTSINQSTLAMVGCRAGRLRLLMQIRYSLKLFPVRSSRPHVDSQLAPAVSAAPLAPCMLKTKLSYFVGPDLCLHVIN